MVVLRNKSFPKKLTKTKDKIDKEIVDFLREEGITEVSHKGYKYLYSAFVLYDIFKYETKKESDKKVLSNYLMAFLFIGEEEHNYENKKRPKILETLFNRVLKDNSKYLINAMIEEHKGNIEKRFNHTLDVGKYAALFCSNILNIKLTDRIKKLIIAANILDDAVEFKEFRDLKLKEKIRLLFLYIKELKKNFVFIKDPEINKGMFNVFALLFVGAFQDEKNKLNKKEVIV